ncbi:DUF3618 domain-containing protein [Primorskyibacter flagellatus]|uniref:DUF3618 domain-containing protein n=1 Tax=Primorskyibacter flagellatus TaxID=1387277 RepID=A0A1W2CHW3_9RHOB|nr:DUF3618 domain-containing protein [Primorskyibacter flagellatus]SMC84837.1 Protein of unknown function [Primorskyibacter flagellatus]
MPVDSSELERELERRRARLGATLEDLGDRLSPEKALQNASEMANDLGHTAVQVAKRNPLALALVGVGVALALSNTGPTAGQIRRGGERLGDKGRDLGRSLRDRLPHADDGDDTVQAGAVTGHTVRATPMINRRSPAWMADVHDTPAVSQSRIEELRENARAKGEEISDAVASRRARLVAKAERLRERFAEGTDHLSTEARNRVVEAREQAYVLSRRAQDAASEGATKARGFYEEHPLVVGALAIAGGAAVGALLQRTDRENRAFGGYSDRFVSEAERVFEEESRKALDAGRAAYEEGKATLKEKTGDASAADVKDAAEETGKRAAQAAKSTAKDEGLGKPTH